MLQPLCADWLVAPGRLLCMARSTLDASLAETELGLSQGV